MKNVTRFSIKVLTFKVMCASIDSNEQRTFTGKPKTRMKQSCLPNTYGGDDGSQTHDLRNANALYR